MRKGIFEKNRFFLKDTIRKQVNFGETDQNLGKSPPPAQKPYKKDQKIIDLPKVEESFEGHDISLVEAIVSRKSIREYSDGPLTIRELSFLLLSTQGVRQILSPAATLRTVPSAGARHALETYLFIRKVENLDEAIYRYLPLSHQLVMEFEEDNLADKISECTLGQRFVGHCAVTFIWTTIPYRMEWRYHMAAHKVIAMDAGHVCQNLYLCCEAINAGTCAIGAYDQEGIDKLLRLDGEEEFVIYIAPVGRKI
ncbi:SagB/ThcOx family dehydrogenase [Spirochaetota bacterium]